MYAYISGFVTEIGLAHAVIEANGVGYLLFCGTKTLEKLILNEKSKLLTHFRVTDDALSLYGFSDEDERDIFKKLLTVSRIGPKLALAVISNLTPSDIACAIVTENAAAFDSVPGMGRKTAARVLLELKGKVDGELRVTTENGCAIEFKPSELKKEAVAALVSLGYDGVTAGKAVAAVKDCDTIEELITLSLRGIKR
ncbi:MAG: Holliday junction branch migration protein RuvA [Clostridia bacterium]